jgi:hypothetical protein
MPLPFIAMAVAAGTQAAQGGINAIGSNQTNKALQKIDADTYDQDNKYWEYNKEIRGDQYQFNLTDNIFQRFNQETEANYRDLSALDDFKYQLAIAQRQDQINISAYNKSVDTYGLQRSFNNTAQAAAVAAEQRKLQDAVTEMSFQNQDITIKALEEAGNMQARGVSGRSAGKALHSVLAQAGRNQAILAESLVSANSNFNQSINKIASDKFGADLQAWGDVMSKPIQSAIMSAPRKLPRALIMDPQKPKDPPRPKKGTHPTQSPILSLATGGLNALSAGYSAYKGG